MGCSFKRQKRYTNTNAFQKIADEFEKVVNQGKYGQIKGSEFYNRTMK